MSHLALHDHGLVGVEGAETAIESMLALYTPTSEMSLGHNRLGSTGTNHLFTRLSHLRGHGPQSKNKSSQKWRLEKITLSGNGIDGDGLRALGTYLDGDRSLKEVYLPHNSIEGPAQLHHLASCILRSSLSVLSLNTNPITPGGIGAFFAGLSGEELPVSWGVIGNEVEGEIEDRSPRGGLLRAGGTGERDDLPNTFAITQITPLSSITASTGPPLPSPLTALHLSMVPLSLPGLLTILPFLCDPARASNLSCLYLNACSLSWRGVYLLSVAIENHNSDLERVEVSSNFVSCEKWLGTEYHRYQTGPVAMGRQADDLTVDLSPNMAVERMVNVLNQTLEMADSIRRRDWPGLQRIARRPLQDDLGCALEREEDQGGRTCATRMGTSQVMWQGAAPSATDRLRIWAEGFRGLLRPRTVMRGEVLDSMRHQGFLPMTVDQESESFLHGMPEISAKLLDTLAQSMHESAELIIRTSLRRNKETKNRVQKSALGCLPIARIVLLGRKQSEEEAERARARLLIQTVEGDAKPDLLSTGWRTPPPFGVPSVNRLAAPFRLLDLPPDIILTILKYSTVSDRKTASSSSELLSERQWIRLFGYAGDERTLAGEARELVRLRGGTSQAGPTGHTTGRRVHVFQDGLSTSFAAPSPLEGVPSLAGPSVPLDSSPPFRPGPGHFGRSEWLRIIGVAGRADSWAGTKSGGTFPGFMPIGLEEKAFVDETLSELGLMRWDSG